MNRNDPKKKGSRIRGKGKRRAAAEAKEGLKAVRAETEGGIENEDVAKVGGGGGDDDNGPDEQGTRMDVGDLVIRKKYLHVLRPLWNIAWIVERTGDEEGCEDTAADEDDDATDVMYKSFPPLEIPSLLASLGQAAIAAPVRSTVAELLRPERRAELSKPLPRVPELESEIERLLGAYKQLTLEIHRRMRPNQPNGERQKSAATDASVDTGEGGGAGPIAERLLALHRPLPEVELKWDELLMATWRSSGVLSGP